jgi:hypothetical protein
VTDWKIWAAVTVLVAIIGAAAVIVAAHVGKPAPPPGAGPAGRILSPKSGERLPHAFAAEGSLAAIPRDHHVWVVSQVGNLLFPKEPEIPSQDRRWSQQVVEAGLPTGGEFSLALFMVGPEGQQVIQDWLDRGKRGKGFPGLAHIPGSVKLDVVGDLTVA